MTIYTVDKLRNEIKSKLSGKRLSHILSVEREIEWLGMHLLPHELLRLKTAALLHDNTKDIPDSEQAALCDRLGIKLSEQERACPQILHAKSGAYTAKNVYGAYSDDGIVQAIAYHTTASPHMTFFDRLLFMADFAEKERKWDRCKQIRAELHEMPVNATLSQKRAYFDRVFLHCLALKSEYIVLTDWPADKQTLEALEAFTSRFRGI